MAGGGGEVEVGHTTIWTKNVGQEEERMVQNTPTTLERKEGEEEGEVEEERVRVVFHIRV